MAPRTSELLPGTQEQLLTSSPPPPPLLRRGRRAAAGCDISFAIEDNEAASQTMNWHARTRWPRLRMGGLREECYQLGNELSHSPQDLWLALASLAVKCSQANSRNDNLPVGK